MDAYVELPDGQVIATDHPEYYRDGKRLPRKAGEAAHQAWACTQLRALLKPSDTVYTVLRSVSASGMNRRISLFAMSEGEPRCIDGLAIAAGVGHRPRNDAIGIAVGGCGMDMGFHLVYNLGARLWPNGTQEPHGTRNGEPDRAGGYALNHRWL